MRNRGTAAILAMIFLVVFSVLSISFCSLATSSMQGARNDRDGMVAMAAAESGMAFIQRTISDVILKQGQATGQEAMQAFYNKLKTLNDTATLGGPGNSIRYVTDTEFSTITIPTITLHADAKLAQQCSAQLTLPVADLAVDRPNITLRVTGFNADNSSYNRTITVAMAARDRTLEMFKYGMFSNGPVYLADNTTNIAGEPADAGNIGSAYTRGIAVSLNGGSISGNVYVSGDPSSLFYSSSSSGSIGGVDIADEGLAEALTHVKEIDRPTVPVFNPNQFAQLDSSGVTRLTQVPENKTLFNNRPYSDICITRNMTFAGGEVLQGLIYVMPGVNVTFAGNVTIQGVVVVQDPNLDANGDPITGSHQILTSTLDFQGTPSFDTPQWPANSVVPPEQQAILNDYSVLGPTLYIDIHGTTGTNDSNTGYGKTVVCGVLDQAGSGNIKIQDGTLVMMSDTAVRGTRGYSGYYDGDGALIKRNPGYHPPYGGYKHLFSWVVDASTYREVAQ